jgi:hypothetical protein
MRLTAVAIGLLAIACARPTSPTLPETLVVSPIATFLAPATVLPPGTSRVLRSEADWQAMWSAVYRGGGPPLPVVDFSVHTLLVAGADLGQLETRVVIEAATVHGGVLTVYVSKWRLVPGPCGLATPLGTPAAAAVVPRRPSSETIQWITTYVPLTC